MNLLEQTQNKSTQYSLLIAESDNITLQSKYTRYRKQIARQLRTQYVEDIYNNPVTLKSRLVGHSTSMETEPWDRSYTTYYQSSYLTLNITVSLKCRSEVIQGH